MAVTLPIVVNGVPAGTGSFGVACHKHRGYAGKAADLDGGLDAARAPGEMKVNDGQIRLYPILKDPHSPDGVSGGTDHRMAKLCQKHLQSKGDQRVILDDHDPHLVTTVQRRRYNDYDSQRRVQ